MNNFANLPTHIIVKILSLLHFDDFKQAVKVCKPWYNASYCITCGHRIKIHFIGDVSNSYKCIKRPFSRLDLTEVNRWNFKYFFKKFAYSIRELRVIRCTITLTKLMKYLSYLPNLELLQIELDRAIICKRTEYSRFNATNLWNIKELCFECYGDQCESLNFILSKCINLKHLTYHINYIRDCHLRLYDYSIVYTSMFEAMAQWPCVNLDSLQIIDQEANITSFFKYFSRLNVVTIKKLKLFEIMLNYDREDFKMFCKQLNSVEELEIGAVNDLELESICEYMHNLRFLYIKKFSGSQLNVIKELKQLQTLNVMELHEYLDERVLLAISNISNVTLVKLTRVEITRKHINYLSRDINNFLMLRLYLKVGS